MRVLRIVQVLDGSGMLYRGSSGGWTTRTRYVRRGRGITCGHVENVFRLVIVLVSSLERW